MSRHTNQDQASPEVLHDLEVHRIELQLQNEELRAARLALEEGLAEYTELFESAPIGYASIDPGGVLLAINAAAAVLLGRERKALVGTTLHSLLSADAADQLTRLVRQVLDNPGHQSIEIELCDSRSRCRNVRITATSAAHETRLLLGLEDLTELRIQEVALRETDRRKDEFLTMLSHELRNPLAPIRTSIFLLQQLHLEHPRAQRAVKVLDRQVGHLTHLVDGLLDLTRLSRGKVELRREPMDLVGLIRDILEDYQPHFERADVTLESELGAGSLPMRADAMRLTQALTNLIGNSLKFTPAGGEVVLSLEEEGSEAKLQVKDTGFGIAPEVLPHVFEPFVQAPQAIDRSRGGLGLGLAASKELIELHEGRISIQSSGPGTGTLVTVWLPLDRGARH